jgi:hypothetical protein
MNLIDASAKLQSKLQTQRNFFDTLAIKWNIRTPQEWNNVSYSATLKEKGSSFINQYYKGSIVRGMSIDI